MAKAYIRRDSNMQMIHKTFRSYEHDLTDNFDTQFRPLPEVVAYDTYFVDPQYGLDRYWDEDLYDQDKLEYKDTYNKPNDQIESDDLFTDADVSEALRFTLIDLWTVNPFYLIHQHYQNCNRDHKTNKCRQQSLTTKFHHSSRLRRTDSQVSPAINKLDLEKKS